MGCYRDKGPKAWKQPKLRAIKVLYKNNRKKISSWDNFFDVIMSCAQAAQAKGCTCFGIQFYGECWCDPLACSTYNIYKDSKKCTRGVGLHWTNFVYKAKCGSGKGGHETWFINQICCPMTLRCRYVFPYLIPTPENRQRLEMILKLVWQILTQQLLLAKELRTLLGVRVIWCNYFICYM